MVTGQLDQASSDLLDLLERAIDATVEGITISDARLPDNPVIYSNEGFERLTGYSAHEVVGRNCRFLQGPGSDPNAIDEIRRAIREGRSCTVELLNYRKDGTPFWNRLSITPLYDAEGAVTHFAGIQSDITPLRETEERLRAANRELMQFERRITRELTQAHDAQLALLPQAMPQDERIAFAHKYVPMTEVGGDFYDVVELDPGVYGILVADVTGHGIHAALLAFMSALSFKNAAPDEYATSDVLQRVNEQLVGKMHGSHFVAMFYAIVDVVKGTLTYTQAGIPPAFLIRARGAQSEAEIICLEAKSPMLGLFEESSFVQASIRLKPGDKVIFYTDALSEAMRPDGEMLGVEGLAAFLAARSEMDIEALVEQTYLYGQTFSGQTQYEDDFSMVGIELKSLDRAP
jgi:PAS domain S-box-containing protein